jgi:hypothetical protein
LAIACAQYLRLALRPPTVWFAVDHGAGKMSPAAAGLLKARGGVAGLPDLIVMHPNAGSLGAIVLGIELKATKGVRSSAQVAMAAAFGRVNADYRFCYRLEDVEHALRTNDIPVHATVAANGSLWPRRAA